jgi:O-antigen ligase
MVKRLITYLRSKELLVYLSMAFAFLLPFAHLLVVTLIFTLIARLIQGGFNFKQLVAGQKAIIVVLLFFYLLHLAGLSHTQNLYSGWFDVKTKVLFLLFVFVYTFPQFKDSAIKMIMYAFIAGLCTASISCLLYASYIYLTEHRNTFFYQDFAVFLHPAYFSLYINFAITWVISLFLNRTILLTRTEKKRLFLSIAFLTIVVILLSSKLGLITLFLIYFIFTIYYIITRKFYVTGVVTVILLIAGAVLIAQLPYVKSRMDNAVEAVQKQNKCNHSESESTAVRLLIWQACNKIIAQHFWFGVGTGDTQDTLLYTYQQEGMTGAYDHNLNAHNQYYQEFIALGLWGFIGVLLLLVIPLYHAVSSKNAILINLVLLLMVNFLTESMLETQAGVAFFAFFVAIFGFGKLTNTGARFTLTNTNS